MKKLITLLFCVVLFSSCSPQKNSGSDNTFSISNGAEPETLNPALSTGVTENRIIRAIFEGLTSLHPKTMKPEPGCAEWILSNDKRTYTFIIKSNAKWSDGSPLTADDFIYSWKRILERKVPASYVSMFFHIANAEEFYKKKIYDFNLVGIKKTNRQTIKVTLKQPVSYFTELTAYPVFYPVNRKCIETHGERWTQPENIVSNGAFKLELWLPRQKIRVVRSEHYHDRNQVQLEAVEFFPYDNLETAYQLFLNGKIDWLPGIPQDKIKEIRYNPDYYISPYLGTYFYRFNCSRPPFDDARVRKAFAMATNRSSIAEKTMEGTKQASTSFCPPMTNYQPAKGLEYNPEKARLLLAEAGFGTAKPFPAVELFYNTSENHKKIAEAIVEQWRNNLKIDVSLRNSEWKTFLADQKKLNYDISRSSWIGDYNDPETFLEIFTSESGNNRTGWKSSAYDTLFQQTRKTAGDERMKLFTEMENILVQQELPVIPIFVETSHGFISERIDGWYENIMNMHPLKYIRIIKTDKQ